jgi:hypothetical protein
MYKFFLSSTGVRQLILTLSRRLALRFQHLARDYACAENFAPRPRWLQWNKPSRIIPAAQTPRLSRLDFQSRNPHRSHDGTPYDRATCSTFPSVYAPAAYCSRLHRIRWRDCLFGATLMVTGPTRRNIFSTRRPVRLNNAATPTAGDPLAARTLFRIPDEVLESRPRSAQSSEELRRLGEGPLRQHPTHAATFEGEG